MDIDYSLDFYKNPLEYRKSLKEIIYSPMFSHVGISKKIYKKIMAIFLITEC